jgi:hypothetical protein
MMDRTRARGKQVETGVAPIVHEGEVDGNEGYDYSSSSSAPENGVREMKAGRTAAVKAGGKRRGARR